MSASINAILHGLTYAEYLAIDAVNHSSLKDIGRSPLHYAYWLSRSRSSKALTIGHTTHTAVLEPHRFLAEYAMWDEKTASGKTRPRNGKDWEAFKSANAARIIITPAEYRLALDISDAVRADAVAMRYLRAGRPEVTLRWDLDGVAFKGRADWLDEASNTIVGLKTTRSAAPVPFGNQSAKLDYVDQWATYADGYECIRGRAPTMIEVAVESAPPHDVVVYRIPPEVLDVGRTQYRRNLALLLECMATKQWPGAAGGREQVLSLPAWAFPKEDDDLDDLGLSFGSEPIQENP